MEKILAAYNAGEEAVETYEGSPALPGDARVRPEGDGALGGGPRLLSPAPILARRVPDRSRIPGPRAPGLRGGAPGVPRRRSRGPSPRSRSTRSSPTSSATGLPRSPTARFVVVTTLFFIVPYLVAGVLLFLADVGASAAAALWSGDRRPSRRPGRAPRRWRRRRSGPSWRRRFSSRRSPGARLPGVAHGGELPGGVNVAPAFVAAVPFVALGAGLLLALLASVPRAVVRAVRRRSDPERGL